MPGSVSSVFGNPANFQEALSKDGMLSLVIIGRGRFRARLTQVVLNDMHLAAGEEQLSRIAFVAVPADTVLVSLPIGDRPAPIWGGMRMQAHEIITLAPGQRVYARTDGPCRWGSIGLPGDDLARYGRVLRGADLA